MQCPQCGGDVWENAAKNVQRLAEGKKALPLRSCKNKDGCGWCVWPPKGQQQGGGNGAGPRSTGSTGRSASSRPLVPLYSSCLDYATRAVRHYLPTATNADIIAAAATLFIAASRDGAPLMAPKAQPAPPPPPPPEPEPEPEYQDDADLPF